MRVSQISAAAQAEARPQLALRLIRQRLPHDVTQIQVLDTSTSITNLNMGMNKLHGTFVNSSVAQCTESLEPPRVGTPPERTSLCWQQYGILLTWRSARRPPIQWYLAISSRRAWLASLPADAVVSVPSTVCRVDTTPAALGPDAVQSRSVSISGVEFVSCASGAFSVHNGWCA